MSLIYRTGFLSAILFLPGISWATVTNSRSERAIELTEKLKINLPESAKKVRIWIPVPADNDYQKTKLLKVESPFSYRKSEDSLFHNRLLYFDLKNLRKAGAEIQVTYQIVRKEERALEPPVQKTIVKDSDPLPIEKYLEPRGLEIISDEIKKIAEETTRDISDPLEKARAIYNYVFNHVQYDKSGSGWGRGDSVYACQVGKGNCTDFHSLFITLARASGIPARFRIGFSLPETSEGTPAGAYHCWAEFYLPQKGWIPVDVSEAWKNPEKKNYLFGNLDPDRVLISTGREISLPNQEGAALNYLAKPYVEIDGQSFENFKLERTYRNIH